MLFEIVIGLASFILNTTLGLIVFLRNPKSVTNRLFLILTLLIDLYLVVNFISLHPPQTDSASQLFWIRFVMSIVSLLGPSLLLLVVTFPHTKMHLRPLFFWGIIMTGVSSFFVSLSPFLFTSIEYPKGEPLPIPGPGMPLFFVSFIGFSFLAAILLVIKYRKSQGIERNQLMYFLIGIVATFSSMAITTVLLTVLFQFTGLVFLGPNTIIFLVVFVAYAIIRHRFLDIRFVITRVITYILLTFFIALGYIALLFNLAFFIQGASPTIDTLRQYITPTFLAIFFVYTYQPLRQFFEKLTSRIFYKDKYNSQDVLWRLSRTMASKLGLQDLSQSILKELLSSLKISYGAIALTRDRSVMWIDVVGNRHQKNHDKDDLYTIIHEAYKPKSQNEQIIIFEELSSRKKDLIQIMRKEDVTVVLPLAVRNRLIGGLLLGEKSSGEVFSSGDIDILKIIAPEVAVAVNNALSYEEIRNFNITLRDEVKKATSRLKKANTKLKELDTLKDEFVSVASHELRTPMTAIKSYLWMALNKSPKKLEDPLKKYLDISYQSTERLIHLVNDMLTVSRIERGKIEIKKEKCDLSAIIKLVYDELKITAEVEKIDFSYDIASKDKEKLFVYGDPLKLREVFQNVVGNALKFTPQNGQIRIVLNNTRHHVNVEVSDTGPGIQKSDMSKLFKKFSKIDYSYAKHSSQPGTGLGLYISKQIISLHDGHIAVQSEVGKGSVFTIELPMHKD